MSVLQLPPSYLVKLFKVTSLMTSVEGENVFSVKCLECGEDVNVRTQ